MVIYGADSLADRRQAYSLLSLAAAEQWHLRELPALERTARGKPFFPNAPGKEFNLSHSGPLALCALDQRPVGVDIQTVKVHRPGLPQKVCSEAELSWLSQGPEPWERFTVLWALKEAKVKHAGTGLTYPISRIQVPLPVAGEALMRLDSLWFRVYSGNGWYGAVCGETQPPDAILWRSV